MRQKFVDFLGIVLLRFVKLLKVMNFLKKIQAIIIFTTENVNHNNLLNRNKF